MPLFGAKVEHIVEKHLDMGGGHCCRTGSHIFGFRGRHGNGGGHGRIGFDESTLVENHEIVTIKQGWIDGHLRDSRIGPRDV